MKNKFSFLLTYGLKKTGLPLIVVEINQQNLCFLLDTGSNKNLLDQKVYEYFKEEIQAVGSGEMFGLDGNKFVTTIIKLSFNFENHTYTTNFNIFDSKDSFTAIEKESDIQIHGILGNEFFIENEWVIDFEKLTLYSK
jgi:hypothetical protein